ncbi:MAG: hypothetical protein A3C70_00965 [Candidatus Zambryskibacteria bacterium RIFCSPHIGHO2_02_FULL_43_14]|uniref:Bacterial Ig domain-containing protein n=1 Tax=Candidatus Zambryskibacteria bacterium RIFCSPHIGHO2_02_FULL_43_14 TaxID=1802748 RepID=A0A1G2TE80_9BACT|nr:MAG: hypothetical protein A2829_03010 [Candidatus Zambryskibacteria bacterium RIFCSPHIGHO2_01_FULL_43_60]OHA95580.1 MAG: hypothetical protein A3C70_00965 [Candidatus Zambryskibacteria bacterium RIFCSPHIGHO2_02_FULL_43_14]OHB02935.1 MAG: hypothetical protein A3B03_03405 [Candidatus Zambryskibacteria bacterium RIFCSPLOWO2_01_FULL_42_41]
MKIDLRPKHAFFIILFILLIVYFLYQARFLILGPQVWIDNPQNDEIVEGSIIIMEGRSSNIAWISLNDRQIFTDEYGKWSEKLIVSPGLSIMTVKARDRFGRETKESVRIVLN